MLKIAYNYYSIIFNTCKELSDKTIWEFFAFFSYKFSNHEFI